MSESSQLHVRGAHPLIPADALHGAVSRPPELGWDGSHYLGSVLEDLDHPPIQAIPGAVAVVRQSHFVGVVAASSLHARQGLESLALRWKPGRSHGYSGDYRFAGEAYRWSPTAVAATGQDVVAWHTGDHVTVWLPLGEAYQALLVTELSTLLELPPNRVMLVGPRESSEPAPIRAAILDLVDAAADAALLSATVRRPVRVATRGCGALPFLALQPDRAHQGASQAAAARADSLPAVSPRSSAENQAGSGWRANTVWALRPSLARLCSQPDRATPAPYPTVRALDGFPIHTGKSPLSHAGPEELNGALVFAQESEAAQEARRMGMDPLLWRLSITPEGPGRALIQKLASQAHWVFDEEGESSERKLRHHDPDGRLRGRGFAAAGMDHAFGLQEWTAWVVEVAVDPDSGRVDIERVLVGHDAGRPEILPTPIQSNDDEFLALANDLVQEPQKFDDWPRTTMALARQASELPTRARSDGSSVTAPVGASTLRTSSIVAWPAAAAIANAIDDACGVRLRTAPFSAEELRGALTGASKAPSQASWFKRAAGWLAGGCAVVAGLAVTAWPAKPAIAPIDAPDLTIFSRTAIERGRLVAAAGDCIVCHTAPGGASNAGGFALETPFGVIYSTNITPDKDTGIGRWSYSAFERAMRHGVHRDGRQLYPAFPYTAFAKMTDADIQALYGYLMSQEPVRYTPPETKLAFPYNLRFTLAGWNLLFHDSKVYEPVPDKSAEWNRGAYLVNGAGHCAACHSPRNALGAEKSGIRSFLAGGEAEGWTAPPLNQLANTAVPWTADDLFQYLRTGYSARHGVAAGPMAPVIHGLAEIPESDVRAIANYLMDLPGSRAPEAAATRAPTVLQAEAPQIETKKATNLQTQLQDWYVSGKRIYKTACAACHGEGVGPTLFGVKPLMASNTNIHAESPDNLIQVILQGVQSPADTDLGYMPGFKEHLSDDQVRNLARYLRVEFAPGQPEWSKTSLQSVARIRHQGEHAASLHGTPPQGK